MKPSIAITTVQWLILLSSLWTAQAAGKVRERARVGAERRHTTETSVGTILNLRLINADTDQAISAHDPLSSKATIDVSTLPTVNLSIEAITDGTVGSIQWSYDDVTRVDRTSPWSLCGNSGSDFFTCAKLKIGFNSTVKAIPYSGKDGTGVAGKAVSIDLALFKTNLNPPVSMSLTLINADTDTEIGPLLDDTVIDISLTPNVNVRANVEPSVLISSVQFGLNGQTGRTDNFSPYSFYGNRGTDYNSWTPPVGRHTITATAFSAQGAQGTQWSSISVSFTIKNQAPVPTAPAPKATPVKPPTLKPASAPTSAPLVSPTSLAPAPLGPDTTKPKLLKLVVFNPIVDVSNGPAKAVFQLTAQDDRSGLDRGLLSVGSNTWFFSASDEYYPPTNTGSDVVVFNLTITFPPLIRNGTYVLAVLLRDPFYNSLDLYYPTLAELGFPNSIEVIDTNEDRSPPKVLEFTALSSTTIDVSKGPASVTFKVVAQDLQFGVKYVDIFAFSGDRRLEALGWLDIPVVGQHEFTIVLEFPAFSNPANYSLQLDVADADFNVDKINATRLAGLGFPSVVSVVNANVDVTPPKLLNFKVTFGSTTINAAEGGSVALTMDVLDDLSGVWFVKIIATYDNGKTIEKSPRFLPFPIKEVFDFTGFFSFDKSSWRGVYTLSIYLRDDEKNEVTITSAELIARGFPGSFTVV
jgi:hypothetical protein